MTTTLWHRSGDRQLKKVALAAAPGAKVQFYAGGTTTPLTTYTDAGASAPHNTASLVTDGNGMWPMIFVPYGSYDYRILDSDDTIINTATNVPNPAPVDPTSTDPNALMQTGDMIFSPAAVSRAGFVRANGNTIGSGASSATERANDDAETLFTWLWDNLADARAAVSGGRGGTAAADWSANKTIATPDLRASSPLGLDDMGAGVASRLGSAPFANGNATTGGSVAGGTTQVMVEANLPAHTHGVGTFVIVAAGNHNHSDGTLSAAAGGQHSHSLSDPGHSHTVTDFRTNITTNDGGGAARGVIADGAQTGFTSAAAGTGITVNESNTHTHDVIGTTGTDGSHTHSMSGETASVGSATAINIVQRSILGTWLLKL